MNRKNRSRASRRFIPPPLLAIAGGPPTYEKSNAGAPPRSPVPKSPEILARQIKVYELRTHGYSVAQIADTLKMARITVLSDHAAELTRRLNETKNERPTLVQQTIARIEASMARAIGRITSFTSLANEVNIPRLEKIRALQAATREERNYLAAIDRWNEVYDLKRTDRDKDTPLENSDAKILRILDLLPVEELMSIRHDAALLEKRYAEEANIRNVTPRTWASPQ